jgi:hypothetical protein
MKLNPQPPTDRNDPVLTYDPINKVVLAVVRVLEGKGDRGRARLETWAFDTGKRAWTKMNPEREPSVSGNRARLLTFLPDHAVAVLENRTHPPQGYAEQQIWTYRYAVPKAERDVPPAPASNRVRTQPALVEDVVASVKSTKEVELRWKVPPGDDIVGYHIERAPVEVWTEDELRVEKSRTTPLKEPSVAALRKIGAFETLTDKPVKATTWTDKVDLSKPVKVEGKAIWERRRGKEEIAEGKPYRFAVYAYRVRAVNKREVKGGPSPYVLTIPSAPQSVFSREQGASCDLKWAKNPEQAIKGYRVYRLDGRFNKQPVSRLTADPIDKTTYTDKDAGKPARRYHIVAVDAIGQEGIPSAPVWYKREWASFYKPFVGEWHQ